FRAGEWDVWMIERAADPAPALIDDDSKEAAAAGAAKKDDEVEPILQLADAWQQSAQKSEELRGDLIDRWTALGKKHGYKAEQMVPDAAQRDKLLRVIEQVYINMAPTPGKTQDKLRVEE